jgi:glutaredoxin
MKDKSKCDQCTKDSVTLEELLVAYKIDKITHEQALTLLAKMLRI